ncbi:MAG: cytochrome c [Campylobacterota bacterium]|nr:cytochrome c [Campylobacterota bacterium]
MKLRQSVILTGALLMFGSAGYASESGEELFKAKCAVCHMTTPPTDFSKLVAPPVFGVMRHVKMQYPNKDEAVKFIKEYTLDPQVGKAVCMPQKIKRFGLMPSQKGKVTPEELERIAVWMFDNFPTKTVAGASTQKANNCKQANPPASPRPPFLINGLMPHLTKMVKMKWDDPTFNLTPEQKTKLIKVRKVTMQGVMDLKPKVNMLEQKIASQSASGKAVEEMMPLVKKLASLKVKATRVHLECIYNTKQILTAEQLAFLLK